MSAKASAGVRAVPVGKTWLAIVANFCFPGLGYWMLGRFRRGLLLGGLVLGSFAMGLMHDGTLALKTRDNPVLTTLQTLGNLGAGPLDAVARWRVYGEAAYAFPHDDHPVARIYRKRMRSGLSNYGTAYLWIAGLMNYLLLFDVWDVSRGRRHE